MTIIEEIRELDSAIEKFETQKAGIDVEIGNRRRKREALWNNLTADERKELGVPDVDGKAGAGQPVSDGVGANQKKQLEPAPAAIAPAATLPDAEAMDT